MSQPGLVGCRGAPRDLGLDQGVAARAAVGRALRRHGGGRLARLTRRLGGDRLARRVDRDAARHYPHMAERGAGLALGAGVGRLDLAALLARELDARGGSLLAVTAERGGSGAALAVALASPTELILRRSAPDNDHASIELVRPWLVPALAGINEHGLAVAATGLGGRPPESFGCMAPAALLVQDCLQRFDTVEKAVDWCAARPAGGCFALLVADASGQAACVRLEREERRVTWPTDGILVASATAPLRDALEKASAARPRLDAGALRGVFREAGASAGALALLDPAGSRLGYWAGDAADAAWLPARAG